MESVATVFTLASVNPLCGPAAGFPELLLTLSACQLCSRCPYLICHIMHNVCDTLIGQIIYFIHILLATFAIILKFIFLVSFYSL